MEKKQLQAVPDLPRAWMSKSFELVVEDPVLALRFVRLSVYASLALRGIPPPYRRRTVKPPTS